MGTNYTTHVYYGAPVEQIGYDDEPPAWMRRDDDEPEREAEDVIAEALGWQSVPYVNETVDPAGHEAWVSNLRDKWRLNKEFGVELGWGGYLEWDERDHHIKITASEQTGDGGESINVSNLTDSNPEWDAKIRRCADILGLTLIEPIGWYATMSAG